MIIQENCFLQIELTLIEIILVPYLVYSFSFHSKYSFCNYIYEIYLESRIRLKAHCFGLFRP